MVMQVMETSPTEVAPSSLKLIVKVSASFGVQVRALHASIKVRLKREAVSCRARLVLGARSRNPSYWLCQWPLTSAKSSVMIALFRQRGLDPAPFDECCSALRVTEFEPRIVVWTNLRGGLSFMRVRS